MPFFSIQSSFMSSFDMIWAIENEKKFKLLAQENNQVCLLEEMTNASALSEKKPPLAVSDLDNWSLLTIFSSFRFRIAIGVSEISISANRTSFQSWVTMFANYGNPH